MTKENEWKKFKTHISNNYNKLDILINNAGIRISGTIEKTSLELWNHIINTNTTSMFLGTKYLLPLLKKGSKPTIIKI